MFKNLKERIAGFFYMSKTFGVSVTIKFYIYRHFQFKYNLLMGGYVKNAYRFYERFAKNIIEQYRQLPAPKTEQSSNIWVCWWQGFDSMPDHCRMCYVNLRKQIPDGYQLHLITQDNYSDYVKLPSLIVEKVQAGRIPVTQFSDILRNALLCQVGGLWIDSSIWVVSPKYFESVTWDKDFWSIHLDHIYKDYMVGQVISECKWASFNMYGAKGNLINQFVFEAMCAYYKEFDDTLDYFGQNFFIRVAYNNLPYAKSAIDAIPLNNPHIYELFLKANTDFNQAEWNNLTSDTQLFKMTQKVSYETCINGNPTYYGYLQSLV